MADLRCVNCSLVFEDEALDPVCKRCGSSVVLEPRALGRHEPSEFESSPPGVWRFAAMLPQVPPEGIVSLGEGGTPILRASALGKQLGIRNLFLKDESRNPTGSFMDRGSTVLVSLAKARGVEECSCLTTGNLGASMAAYCAKAGISARITIDPRTDQAKLYQMLAYGAHVDATPRQPRVSEGRKLAITAGNPYLLAGEKTTCFEILQELDWNPPDAMVLPVGTGGHLAMTWHGLMEAEEAGLVKKPRTRLMGARIAGPSRKPAHGGPIHVPAFTELEESEPYLSKEAQVAMKSTGGMDLSTTGGDAINATGLLARAEGIFAEPASASVVSCLAVAAEKGEFAKDDIVVCVITGAGLKDAKAVSRISKEIRRVPVRSEAPAPRAQLGQTKFEILRSLSAGSSYGYGIWQDLKKSREITTASVYQHLAELEGMRLVRRRGATEAGGRERLLYELSRGGADLLTWSSRYEKEHGKGREQQGRRRVTR